MPIKEKETKKVPNLSERKGKETKIQSSPNQKNTVPIAQASPATKVCKKKKSKDKNKCPSKQSERKKVRKLSKAERKTVPIAQASPATKGLQKE